MCRILVLTFFIFSTYLVNSQTIDQKILLDFGPNDIINGNITTNPDQNGNYWNNVVNPFTTNPSTKVDLVNISNNPTSYQLEITNQLASNGIMNGGLLFPDPLLLGDYAIDSATQDYFFTDTSGSITFSSLDADKGYQFKIFGSRNAIDIRESSYQMNGFNSSSGILQTSGTDIGGTGYHGNNSTVYESDIIFPDCNGEIKITVTKHSGSFAYINLIELIEYNDATPLPLNNNSIAIMGSSVANGQGANLNNGYVSLYETLLQQRFLDGDGLEWSFTNISVPGNNTLDVLNRWDCDLLPELTKYVVYGLSLWNEGIHDFGQSKFNQFRDNMELLINNSIAIGKTPIIMNCYPNNHYNSTDYAFVKDMNLLIHQWGVPSINLLGAIDDTTGKWVVGYDADASHPNNLGHSEFFYAIVPSLFDALDSGKPQPTLINGTYLSMGSSVTSNQIVFTPENEIHSFTNSFDIKTSSTGNIVAITTVSGVGYLSINASGYIKYISPSGSEIIGSTIVNDNLWHKISLTHYYAHGKTILYTDKIVSGSNNEQLVCDNFYLHPLSSPSTIDFKDWHFYRSAMTSEEIDLLNDGVMLKSSLELYAPLDGQAVLGADELINLAQSTNTLRKELQNTLSSKKITNDFEIHFYPNPVEKVLTISTLDSKLFNKIDIHDVQGRLIFSVNKTNKIDFSSLIKGVYFLKIYLKENTFFKLRVVKN